MSSRGFFNRRSTPLVAASILAAGLLAGCGTDEQATRETSASSARYAERETRTERTEGAASELPYEQIVDDVPGPASSTTQSVPPAVTPSVDPHADYLEAESRFHRGDHTGAVTLLRSSVTARPDFLPAQYLLGLSLRKTGEHAESEAAFREALRIEPGHLRARVNLARVLIDAGRPSEALAQLAAIDADSVRADEVWNVRGLALLDLGDLQAADTTFSRAVEIDPGNVYALNNLGLCRIRAGKFQEALAPLEEAASRPGAPAYVFNNLGVARERTGDVEAAADAYATAVENGHSHAALSLARVKERIEWLARTAQTSESATTAAAPSSGERPDPTPEPAKPSAEAVQVTEGS